MTTTLHADCALVAGQWQRDVRVSIDAAGRIASVHTDALPQAGDQRLSDRVLLPAPGNLHSHAFQRAMAGRTERRSGANDSFWTWREQMYRFVDRMTPDHLLAVAALAYVEMLEAGYAAVAEFHYLHHAVGGAAYANIAETTSRIVAATETAGIGLTHLPVLYQRGGLDGRPPAGGQQRFACDADRFATLMSAARDVLARTRPDARLGVAPHSLRAVDSGGLKLAIELVQGGPIHIHIAEQTGEVDEVLAATGLRPVQWLLEHVPVDDRWCLLHATHLDDAEVASLAASGATVGLAPVTEANLGDGIFRAVDFRDAGGRFGIGTDSNVRIDLAEELRTLEYGQRLQRRSRAVIADDDYSNGRVLFDAACAGGAAALGRASGEIAPGNWADLLTLDRTRLDLAGVTGDGWLDAWIFSAPGRVVRDVWSAGHHRVRDGRHVEREAVEAAYRRTLAELTG
ncbi:formimidoylglutamate deiminase [uncultured Abyssibacter sp.]|uniref:formimidoylglutamate deiminase n=1 Tax=uncultured Abyssibacter sp. TaxID=2320202 RepID=UPI0032B10AF6